MMPACSHAGIVNVGLEARRLLPDDLTERVEPGIVAPGHCTGWRAAGALAAVFSPTGYAPSVVGSRYVLGV